MPQGVLELVLEVKVQLELCSCSGLVGVDRGPNGGSSVLRPWREDPHRCEIIARYK